MKTSTAIKVMAISSIVKSGYSIYTMKKMEKARKNRAPINFTLEPLQPFPTEKLMDIVNERRKRSDEFAQELMKKYPLELNP